MNVFRDRLAAVGSATGVLLVVMALAKLSGTPWAYASGGLVAALQVVGILATVAVGVGLAYVALRG